MPCSAATNAARARTLRALAVDDGNAYLQAGLAGWASCGCPTTARPHLASGELARLFEDWDMETMPMYCLAYPPNRHVSAKLRAFIDWSWN